MMFALSLDERHDALLRGVMGALSADRHGALLSSGPIDQATASDLWAAGCQTPRFLECAASAKRLCMDLWPASVLEAEAVLTKEPGDTMAWRRRNLLSMVLTGGMVFVVDAQVGTSQELITLLTFARMNNIKTIGIIPGGLPPASVPLGVLAATDVVVSGEADSSRVRAALRSLTEEG